MVTVIYMTRIRLITMEQMDNYCKGKEDEKESISDDLDSFNEDIRLGEEPDHDAFTYFLTKLTKEEMKLVDIKDENFMHNFLATMDADVSKVGMEASESNSKFVLAWGARETFTIEYSLKRNFEFQLLQ